MYKDWLKVAVQMVDGISPLTCPVCGKQTVEFAYIGNKETRIGFLPIWCSTCNKGIHISRVKAPETVKMIDFDDTKTIMETVPNFSLITK